MTVAAELLKRAQRMEYFICIEGIGWPTNWNDLSAGFSGQVWATNDLDGNLAATLGCTVLKGLGLPRSISSSVDPRTGSFSMGGISVSIQDRDDWFAENYTPYRTGYSTTLTVNGAAPFALEYYDTRVDLVDGTNFATGAVVWIAGRECIKLGTKTLVSGTHYYYSGSTRGYLGTQVGSSLKNPKDFSFGVWPSGTSVNSVARLWINRKVLLFAHVPGETVANCLMLWMGSLKGLSNPDVGIKYELQCNSDFMNALNRKYNAKDWVLNYCGVEGKYSRYGSCGSQPGGVITAYRSTTPIYVEESADLQKATKEKQRLVFEKPIGIGDDLTQDDDGTYSLAFAYNYRCVSGGTRGAIAAWNIGTVQALNSGVNTAVIGTFVQIADQIIFLYKREYEFNDDDNPKIVIGDLISSAGTSVMQGVGEFDSANYVPLTVGEKARFLLSNWHSDLAWNRFHVDRSANPDVARNPVNLLLFFLTSMDNEHAIYTTSGGGHTTTVLNFAATNVADNFWAGKVLFSVDDDNRFQCRKIVSNTSTSITVEDAFNDTPLDSKEYQVRNSQYDTLPFGWGLGVDSKYIDIDSFETVRDQYLSGVVVDKFFLGTDDNFDIWSTLVDNICVPYGIMIYLNRDTRKITARYLPVAINADTIEDYVTISESDIVERGQLKSDFIMPTSKIELNLRDIKSKCIALRFLRQFSPSTPRNVVSAITNIFGTSMEDVPGTIGENKDVLLIRSKEIENAFSESDTEVLQVSAMFNTRETCDFIVQRLVSIAGRYCIPPPIWECKLRVGLFPQIIPGMNIQISWNNAPVNPFTGVRGWSNIIGRIVSISLPLDGKSLSMSATIELFEASNRGKIAPACTPTSKGNDGTYDYFVVNQSDFVNDPYLDKDFYHFGAGDLIQLRDATGVVKENETIVSFGTNHSSTPQGANSYRINVAGSISSTISAGDYITFQNWSVSNTARMEQYSAYANATTELLTGNDQARIYL